MLETKIRKWLVISIVLGLSSELFSQELISIKPAIVIDAVKSHNSEINLGVPTNGAAAIAFSGNDYAVKVVCEYNHFCAEICELGKSVIIKVDHMAGEGRVFLFM